MTNPNPNLEPKNLNVPTKDAEPEESTPAKRQERAIADGHPMDHDNPAAASASHESPLERSTVGEYNRSLGITPSEPAPAPAPPPHADVADTHAPEHKPSQHDPITKDPVGKHAPPKPMVPRRK